MMYLSQILKKPIYHNQRHLGMVVDLAAVGQSNTPSASFFLIRAHNKRFFVEVAEAEFKKNSWIIKKQNVDTLPVEEKSLFLSEDLLDKQVIDINGRRLVRVNDVVLKQNGGLKVEGIDIGFSGIVRRLGLPNILGLKTITLPWSVIQAFDYQTGTIQIKLTQNNLNTFHPAEIADILEEAGTKERLSILESLDTQKAAAAIEEANEETQTALLEQVSSIKLKNIVDRMHLSEIADIFHIINPFTGKQIISSLGKDKAKKLQKLLVFQDDVAGGMMEMTFLKERGDKTVGEMLARYEKDNIRPESIVVTTDGEKLLGVLGTRNLVNRDSSMQLSVLPMHKHFVFQNTSFTEIFKQFAEYNVRTLPVIDSENVVVGIIKIDNILARIQQEEEKEDAL